MDERALLLVVFALISGCWAGTYPLDDRSGLGLRWEGVGAISGGGATTKLLKDYSPATASDIMDYLFKPGFGLNLQMLKVEIGGDMDATEGAEPSHMHANGDEDYDRGYEWWLMKEAKARNPDIKLYGLPWGWPGWLDPKATADKRAWNAFADPDVTANYTLAWLLGAKRVHGLDIDYVGQWNERNAPAAYASALRAAVATSTVAHTTTVLDRLPHYPGTTDTPDTHGCAQYAWNTTDGSRWVDEEGSTFDGRSARCLARAVNRGYISGCHTATFQWHLVSSFYDYLQWPRCGVAVANTPWSGAYEITSPTWALAHTSQFAPVGWRYAAHGNGSTMLAGGGSLVTRISPDCADFSVVVEKMTSANSACARGSNPSSSTSAENVTLVLRGAFLQAVTSGGRSLHVWRSDLASDNAEGANPAPKSLFQRQAEPLAVAADGTATVLVGPEEIVTITTLTTGNKGSKVVPPASPFPLPFRQSFDEEMTGLGGKYWYDQMGAWEVVPDSVSSSRSGRERGNVLRQQAPVWPACWEPLCPGPTTYFGPSQFGTNLTLSMDVKLEDHGALTLAFPGGGGFKSATVNTDGSWSLGLLKRGSGLNFTVNAWHTLSIGLGVAAEGDTEQHASAVQTLVFDGELVTSTRGTSSTSSNINSDSDTRSTACDNNTFPVELNGRQFLGLVPGPSEASTPELCAHACCASGPGCNMWQFSPTPSKGPDCWYGSSTQSTTAFAGSYISRARVSPDGWRLKLSLDRYVHAAIDNFAIE